MDSLALNIGLPLLIYFSTIPFISYLISEITGEKRRKTINKTDPVSNLSFQKKHKRRLTFGFKEHSKKLIIIIIYFVSMIIGPIVSLFNLLYGSIIAFILPIVLVLLVKIIVNEELIAKDTLISRMLDFKKAKMGLVNNESNILNYYNEFEIIELDKDDGKPSKIRLKLPITFDPFRANEFLETFSTQFGRGRPFELDYSDADHPGWNTDTGIATITLQRPLPQKAMWDKYYIEHPDIKWSYFPLGIGSRGGIPIKDKDTGEEIHLIGFDVSGEQVKYCNKNNIPIQSDIVASPHILGAGVTGAGKSVGQWNIMNGCLGRPDRWLLLGMDMKKVELSKLRQFGVPVGTTLEDCADIALFAQTIMMSRFEEMERRGINNWADMPDDERGPAVMIMCDEAGELFAKIDGKDDESKEKQMYQDICRASFESIARLGRAAQTHLSIFAQRPDSNTINMQIRQNCPSRVGYGTLPSTISQMLLEDTVGSRIQSSPKGRGYLRNHSTGNHFQGFYCDAEKWLLSYYEEKGWPLDIQTSHGMLSELSSTEKELDDSMNEDDFDELDSVR